jgi:hypothetical protein
LDCNFTGNIDHNPGVVRNKDVKGPISSKFRAMKDYRSSWTEEKWGESLEKVRGLPHP